MKKIYKTIGITTALALIIGFTCLGTGTKTSATTTKYEPTKVVNKSLTSNKITSLDSKAIVSFSSNIVIYNSEPYENYPSGKKVTDIGYLLNNRLKEKDINSNFISNTVTKERPTSYKEYLKSYDATRNLITQNVKDYNSAILLDVCRNKVVTKNIVITLVPANPHYAENKKFAESLVAQFNKLNQPAVIQDYPMHMTYFNQDLSNRSILIEIGNFKSSDSELNQIVNTVATALQNLQQK